MAEELSNQLFAKYIEDRKILDEKKAALNALEDMRPRLLRAGAYHPNSPWKFTSIQINPDVYEQAYNDWGFASEEVDIYEYLLFLVWQFNTAPPAWHDMRRIESRDIKNLLNIMSLRVVDLATAENFANIPIDLELWQPRFQQQNFVYPRYYD